MSEECVCGRSSRMSSGGKRIWVYLIVYKSLSWHISDYLPLHISHCHARCLSPHLLMYHLAASTDDVLSLLSCTASWIASVATSSYSASMEMA